MLAVTYLGHSGWLIQTENNAVLVDPLLKEDFGRGPAGARMPAIWPPRNFSFEAFPDLDSVIVSHEHEDHFNLPSLNLIDRKLSVRLSSRSSVAAYEILEEMGFTAVPFGPGDNLCFGALEVMALSPDHITTFNSDEWDGLALFARDRKDGGCFFTPIDVRITERMLVEVDKTACGASAMLVYSYDHISFLPTANLRALLSDKADTYSRSQGVEARSALNTGKGLVITPGQTIVVSATSVERVEDTTTFVCTPPQESWGAQPPWRYHRELGDYLPASNRYEVTTSDMAEITSGLQELAKFLYGSLLYRRLYSLSSESQFKARLTFALALLTGQSRQEQVFEYRPQACAFFIANSENPFLEYAIGVECWASDLLALIRGDFEPRILSLGHSRIWRSDRSFPDPFLHVLWPFFHPQRWPTQCLRAYRSQLAEMGKSPVLIRSRVAPSLDM